MLAKLRNLPQIVHVLNFFIEWSLLNGLSRKQLAVLQKGMALMPKDRYTNMQNFLDDLTTAPYPQPVVEPLKAIHIQEDKRDAVTEQVTPKIYNVSTFHWDDQESKNKTPPDIETVVQPMPVHKADPAPHMKEKPKIYNISEFHWDEEEKKPDTAKAQQVSRTNLSRENDLPSDKKTQEKTEAPKIYNISEFHW